MNSCFLLRELNSHDRRYLFPQFLCHSYTNCHYTSCRSTDSNLDDISIDLEQLEASTSGAGEVWSDLIKYLKNIKQPSELQFDPDHLQQSRAHFYLQVNEMIRVDGTHTDY